MPSFTAAVLCDFAQVRDGLLFVSSGGVARGRRESLPAALGVMLAMVVEVTHDERELTHEVRVSVKRNATAETIFRWVAGFQVGDPSEAYPGESLYIPVVASEMANAVVPGYGDYDVRVNVDGVDGPLLTFYVVDK